MRQLITLVLVLLPLASCAPRATAPIAHDVGNAPPARTVDGDEGDVRDDDDSSGIKADIRVAIDTALASDEGAAALEHEGVWPLAEQLGYALTLVHSRLLAAVSAPSAPADIALARRIGAVLAVVLNKVAPAKAPPWWHGTDDEEAARLIDIMTLYMSRPDLRDIGLTLYERAPSTTKWEPTADILIAHFADAPDDDLAAYARPISRVILGNDLLPKMWRAFTLGYAESVRRTAQTDGTRYISAPAALAEARWRVDLIEKAARYLDEHSTHVLRRAVEVEPVWGVLEYLTQLIDDVPDTPDCRAIIAIAMARDFEWLQLAAIDWIRDRRLEREFADALIACATSYRRSVADEAAAMLTGLGVPIPDRPPLQLPPRIVEALTTIATTALDDVHFAQRVHVVQTMEAADGSTYDFEFDGWDFSATDRRVLVEDRNLRRMPYDTALQTVAPIDFRAEVLDRIAARADGSLDETRDSDSDLSALELDLVRIAWILRTDGIHDDERLDLASRLATEVAQELVTLASVVSTLAYVVGWLRFEAALVCHSNQRDVEAREYAELALTLETCAIEDSDVPRIRAEAWADWMSGVRRVIADLDARAATPLHTDPPADRGDVLAYWIARLRDVDMLQQFQPGGPGFVDGGEGERIRNAIVAFGIDAVWPLFDVVGSADLVRGYGFWRDFHRSRNFCEVGDVAKALLHTILAPDIGEPPRQLLKPEQRGAFKAWLEPRLTANTPEAKRAILLSDLERDLPTDRAAGALRRVAELPSGEVLPLISANLAALARCSFTDPWRSAMPAVKACWPLATDDQRAGFVAAAEALDPAESWAVISVYIDVLYTVEERDAVARFLPRFGGVARAICQRGYVSDLRLACGGLDPDITAAMLDMFSVTSPVEFNAWVTSGLRSQRYAPALIPGLVVLLDDSRETGWTTNGRRLRVCDQAYLALIAHMPMGDGPLRIDHSPAWFDHGIGLLRTWLATWSNAISLPADETDSRLWSLTDKAVAAWRAAVQDTPFPAE